MAKENFRVCDNKFLIWDSQKVLNCSSNERMSEDRHLLVLQSEETGDVCEVLKCL